jgi:hypothetical protein
MQIQRVKGEESTPSKRGKIYGKNSYLDEGRKTGPNSRLDQPRAGRRETFNRLIRGLINSQS